MEPHVGNWDAVRVPSKRSIVPLPSDFKDVAHPLPPFTDSTAFVNLFPSLQINVTWDCLWWMRLIPEGVNRTKILMGRETVIAGVARVSYILPPPTLTRPLIHPHTHPHTYPRLLFPSGHCTAPSLPCRVQGVPQAMAHGGERRQRHLGEPTTRGALHVSQTRQVWSRHIAAIATRTLATLALPSMFVSVIVCSMTTVLFSYCHIIVVTRSLPDQGTVSSSSAHTISTTGSCRAWSTARRAGILVNACTCSPRQAKCGLTRTLSC